MLPGHRIRTYRSVTVIMLANSGPCARRRIYPASGPFAIGYRNQHCFAGYVSQGVGRIDMADGNAAYAFASLSNSPVDLLVTATAPSTCRRAAT